MVSIPEHLHTTYAMLKEAFDKGLSEAEYDATIKVLYDEMSDRNIAIVLSLITNKDESQVINDVYRVSQSNIEDGVVDKVKSILKPLGYEEWLDE